MNWMICLALVQASTTAPTPAQTPAQSSTTSAPQTPAPTQTPPQPATQTPQQPATQAPQPSPTPTQTPPQPAPAQTPQQTPAQTAPTAQPQTATATPATPPTPAAPEIVPGITWATAGADYTLFACRDVNGDGFEDIVAETPQKGLIVSESVHGWKAANWRALDLASWPGGIEAFEKAAKAQASPTRIPTAPPYESELKPIATFQGDLDGDKSVDTIAIFHCTRPDNFLDLRVAFGPSPNPDDTDGDGLPNSQEIAIGTDPNNRDTDGDGLLDGWEVLGLPREIKVGEKLELNPLRQDVLVAIAPYEGVDVNALKIELDKAAKIYRDLPSKNPDGSTGITVHYRIDPTLTKDKQAGGDWAQCGNANFPNRERGILHWMQVTPWGGGQSQQTGDMGGCGPGFAVFAHEFGHQLSLSHEGDSPLPWCPLYPSLMNYAFSYSIGGDGNAVHFSTGRFRDTVLDEHKLIEKLPYPYAEVKYLEAGPFRFPLKENGPNETLIDWNQNGKFDEQPVAADINYGGSTNCGTRVPLDFTSAAPALGYVGDACFLAFVDTTQAAISLRNYKGDAKWSDPRPVPNSATNGDPLIVGTKDKGFLFFRRVNAWCVARFDATTIDEPLVVADLPLVDIGANVVAGRVLVVTRDASDALKTYWFTCDGKTASVKLAQELELHSKVPVGFAELPGGGRIAMASSMANSNGAPMCMRVTWYRVAGDRLAEDETKWVRGEASGTNCATRPVVMFDSDGQLNIYHTAIPGGNGLMTGWRTRRIGNQVLDDGWLTCLLYDVWTSSRRAVTAATGAQGAIYAFRWDADGWTKNNTILVGHNAFGLDTELMRDFDDGEKMSKYGLVHSILWMQQETPHAQ